MGREFCLWDDRPRHLTVVNNIINCTAHLLDIPSQDNQDDSDGGAEEGRISLSSLNAREVVEAEPAPVDGLIAPVLATIVSVLCASSASLKRLSKPLVS